MVRELFYDIFRCRSHESADTCDRHSTDDPACNDEHKRSWSFFDGCSYFPVIVCVNVGILTTCIVISHYIAKETAWIHGPTGPDGRMHEFYVPCDLVSLSFEEDLETFDNSRHDVSLYRDENGTRLCKFTNLTAVIEKATERKARQRVAEGLAKPRYQSCGNFSNRPQDGKYVAFFSQLESVQKRAGPQWSILQWSEDPSNSFVGSGISYNNGRIQVDVGQFYFVYVTATYNRTKMAGRGFRPRVFILDITTGREQDGVEYTTRDLQFVGTVSDCGEGGSPSPQSETISTRQECVGTAFVGSQVFLTREDVLYVTVNDDERLIRDAPGISFGIYAS